jgi:choline dehydrogenase
MRPLSHGYVEAKSNSGDMLAINPRYLSEEADPASHHRRAALCPADVCRVPAKAVRAGRELPGIQIQRDDELLDYARRNGGTCYHASCACIIGRHAVTVVDDELRVLGPEGLRVIDASLMSEVTRANTNAPAIMIAEKGTDRAHREARAAELAVTAGPVEPPLRKVPADISGR